MAVYPDDENGIDPVGGGTFGSQAARVPPLPPVAPPDPGTSSEFNKSIGQVREAIGERDAVVRKNRERLEPLEENLVSDLDRPQPKAPQLQSLPKAPHADLASDAQNWMVTAGVVGLLAGIRGRMGSQNALAAFAGTLDGMREGDQAKFDASLKKWKAESEGVIVHNQQLIDQYNLVLKSNKINTDQKLQQLKLIASINDDKAAEQSLRVQGLTEIAKTVANYEKHQEDMKVRTATLEQRADDHRASLDEKKRQFDEKNALAKQKLAGTETPMSQEAKLFFAQQDAAGDHSWATGFGRGAQGASDLRSIRELSAQIQREMGRTGADAATASAIFGGEKAAARTAAQRLEIQGMYASAADALLDQAVGASDRLPRADQIAINRAIQAWQNQTGSEELRAFGAANNSAINAYAKAIAAGGAGTVSDKEHAREVLSLRFGAADYRAAVLQLKQEIAAEKEALEKNLRDFPQRHGSPPVSKTPAGGLTEGAIATNPSTGQKMIYRDGKWQILQ